MAWPDEEIDLEVGLFMGGVWVDAVSTGDGVRSANQVALAHGRADWATQVDPSRASFTLDNRDGRWSPDNPTSPHAGNYRRNIPCRVGIGRGEIHMEPTEASADLASTPDILGAGGGAPTAPAFVDVTESEETAYTTLHTYDYPATLAADDRLAMLVNLGHESAVPLDQGGGVTDMDDWTLVRSGNLYTPWNRWMLYERGPLTTAEASALAGTTMEFSTPAGGVRSSAMVIRTSGARAGGEGVGFDVVADTVTSFSDAPNPPSLTADWGADEHRWYAMAVFGSGGETVSTYSTSYTEVAQGHVTSLVQVAAAHRTTAVATEDPGVWALSGDENWMALTLVYRAEEDTSADGVLDVSGDIDVRAEFELGKDLVDINEGGSRARLAHKRSGADGWEWELHVIDGAMGSTFSWRDSGGVARHSSTAATGVDLPLDFLHEHRALRVDLDVDNGAAGHDVRWYTSTTIDGAWTQLGSTVTVAGTTSIKTNDAPLRVGGNPADGAHIPLPAKIYAFDLRNETDVVVANPRFNTQAVGATGFTDVAGRVWSIGTGGRITNMLWRFHGELASLPVRWNVDGSDVWAPVEATGLFRRLRQGRRLLASAIRRAIIHSASNLIQYWPLEEVGVNVESFGPAVGTAIFDVSGGIPQAATDSTFLAAAPLPKLATSTISTIVDDYTATSSWQVRWLQLVPDGFTSTESIYFGIITTDMSWFVLYRDNSGGQLQVKAFRGATEVYASAWGNFAATGRPFRMTMAVRQNGTSVDVTLLGQEPGEPLGGGIAALSAVAGTAGKVTSMNIGGALDVGDWVFGHVTLQGAQTSSAELADELNAYSGELAANRVMRLCHEEGVKHRIEGDPASTESMGPQRSGTLMGLLEECAATDLGILHESREDMAVGYRTRTSILDQPVIIDLDYTAGEVAKPPELDRDDNGFANDVTVTNQSGATARSVLDDGSALSVSEPPVGAGSYDSTFRVNSQDDRLKALANTRLALSTVDEPRVSRLALGLHHDALVTDSALTAAILDSSLGDRVKVSNNLPKALGTATIDQIVQGTRERIGSFTHTIDALTTPFSPWTAGGGVTPPPVTHSVTFRSQNTLATAGTPVHVLEALGYTGTYPITRADIDGILDDWVAGTGGTTRNVTSAAEWTTAIGAAVPGDLVRVTTGYDPGGAATVRGDLYGIGGSNLTASSGDGGNPGLPIIVTCADGVYLDDNNTSSNVPVLDMINCRHVWAVGMNVRDGQFGIRGMNWGGTDGFPAYIAYCDVSNIGDAGIAVQGWFQTIAASGGTPPAGTGNTYGFSQFAVIEENDIDGVGKRSASTGEGIYLGRGSVPGWVAYCEDVWVRGNRVTDWTSDGIEVKPGCRRIYVTDNEVHLGHAVSGAPMGSLYVNAGIDARPAFFDRDPELWIEANRVYDNDTTNTDAGSVHIMGYIGLSGMRIANNVFWAHPTSGAHATWRVRHEHGTNDTEALAAFRNDPTWVINNTCWGDDSFENAGYGNPFVGPMPGTIDFDLRNNIVDQASPATGEVDAASADFIATVPAIGVAGDAEWETYGNGSAFDLDPTSALVGAGEDITDITFLIEEDISGRSFDKTAPNPGAFQPFT